MPLLSFWICGWSTNGLIGTHFIPAAHDHGMPATTSASLLALIGIFDIVGTVASGWLTDRVDSRYLLFTYYFFRGLSLLVVPWLLADTVHPSLFVFIVFYGLDWVATVPPTVALCRQHFGIERSGVVFGWVFAATWSAPGSAASFAGWVRQVNGDYFSAWMTAGGLCLGAAALCLLIPRHPVGAGGDRERPHRCDVSTFARHLGSFYEGLGQRRQDMKAEESEFGEFMTASWARLFRTSYLLTGNRQDAEDLVQTVLARTCLRWHSIRDKRAAEAYVRRGLVREVEKIWRRRGREVVTDDVPDAGHAGGLSTRADHLALWQEVRKLPPRMRATSCCATSRTSPRPRPPRRSGAPSARSRARPITRSRGCAPRCPTRPRQPGGLMTNTDIHDALHSVGHSVEVPNLDAAGFATRVRRVRTRRTATRVGGAASCSPRWSPAASPSLPAAGGAERHVPCRGRPERRRRLLLGQPAADARGGRSSWWSRPVRTPERCVGRACR